MTAPPRLFDRRLLRLRRERAVLTQDDADFLIEEMVERLVERLDEIQRPFTRILVLGSHAGRLAMRVRARDPSAVVVETDTVPRQLGPHGLRVVCDEEALPFAGQCFDAVLSCGILHWVDDLPGTLAQIMACLRPDGLLLAALPGGGTLGELRDALLAAEMEVEGGASPRVAPFIDVRDAGGLLQRAHFALPMVDRDRIDVAYGSPLALMRDLRAMGESTVVRERRPGPIRRATLARACAIYAERFGDADGRVRATFEILFLTAWKPAPDQPQPARRGSGRVDLARMFGIPTEPPSG